MAGKGSEGSLASIKSRAITLDISEVRGVEGREINQ